MNCKHVFCSGLLGLVAPALAMLGSHVAYESAELEPKVGPTKSLQKSTVEILEVPAWLGLGHVRPTAPVVKLDDLIGSSSFKQIMPPIHHISRGP